MEVEFDWMSSIRTKKLATISRWGSRSSRGQPAMRSSSCYWSPNVFIVPNKQSFIHFTDFFVGRCEVALLPLRVSSSCVLSPLSCIPPINKRTYLAISGVGSLVRPLYKTDAATTTPNVASATTVPFKAPAISSIEELMVLKKERFQVPASSVDDRIQDFTELYTLFRRLPEHPVIAKPIARWTEGTTLMVRTNPFLLGSSNLPENDLLLFAFSLFR